MIWCFGVAYSRIPHFRLSIPDGLFRFCKFDVPLFTPTTKAELGAHDENMTMEEVTAEIGPELAAKVPCVLTTSPTSHSKTVYQR